jgi:hypothetical protein
MNTEQRPPKNVAIDADDGLTAARAMPPGPERVEALKKAAQMRNATDVYGLIFAERDRALK